MRNGFLFYCNMCQINILLNRFHVRLMPLTEDKNMSVKYRVSSFFVADFFILMTIQIMPELFYFHSYMS